MSRRVLCEKMHMIYRSDIAERVEWKAFDGEQIMVDVDVHQMTCAEAKRFIQNVITLLSPYKVILNVIHGYVHGTSIKEMIYKDSINNRIEKIMSPSNNPGISILMIAGM